MRLLRETKLRLTPWELEQDEGTEGESPVSMFWRVIRKYSKVIEQGGDNAMAFARRGIAHYLLGVRKELKLEGLLDLAIEDFNEALALGLDHAEVYATRGLTYRVKNNWERAIADYEKAVSFDETNAGMVSNLAAAYEEKGDLQRAIAIWGRVVALAPDNPGAFACRASAYRKKGDFKRAEQDDIKFGELTGLTNHAEVMRAAHGPRLGTQETKTAEAHGKLPVDQLTDDTVLSEGGLKSRSVEQPAAWREMQNEDTQTVDRFLEAYLAAEGLSDESRGSAAAKIREMVALIKAQGRPKWDDRHKFEELKYLPAPAFLKRVHSAEIGPEKIVRKEWIRALDASLMGAVESYISKRKGRGSDLGDASDLVFVASQPARNKVSREVTHRKKNKGAAGVEAEREADRKHARARRARQRQPS